MANVTFHQFLSFSPQNVDYEKENVSVKDNLNESFDVAELAKEPLISSNTVTKKLFLAKHPKTRSFSFVENS